MLVPNWSVLGCTLLPGLIFGDATDGGDDQCVPSGLPRYERCVWATAPLTTTSGDPWGRRHWLVVLDFGERLVEVVQQPAPLMFEHHLLMMLRKLAFAMKDM